LSLSQTCEVAVGEQFDAVDDARAVAGQEDDGLGGSRSSGRCGRSGLAAAVPYSGL